MPKHHQNFYNLIAGDHYSLGLIMGKTFADYAKNALAEYARDPQWRRKVGRAEAYLKPTYNFFPRYLEELQGYAKGAGVVFEDLWTLSLEDEAETQRKEKCTTVITNNGKLISHNEDWNKDSEDSVCVLLKSIGETKILEIFYFNTLGGNSISINSHGFIVAVNSLEHSGRQIGVPRNVIARWLSETNNPEFDAKKLKRIPRGAAYSLNFINREGAIWNIEYTSTKVFLNEPQSPFAHTNHYLIRELKTYEANIYSSSTLDRLLSAESGVKKKMSIGDLKKLTGDMSKGSTRSIFNEKTIGRVVVDLNVKIAHIWLRREQARGWVEYRLDELLGF